MPLSFSNRLPSLYTNYGNGITANSTSALSAALKKKLANQPGFMTGPLAINKPSVTPNVPPPNTPPAPIYTPPSQQQPAQANASQGYGGGSPANAAVPGVSGNASGQTNGATGQQPPTFSGILYDLIKKATEGNKNVNNAKNALTGFQKSTADKIAAISSEAIPLEFQQGRAQVVQQASAVKEAALSQNVQNALTAQGQELSALQGAAGLTTPEQLGSGNVYIDPVTGRPIASGPTLGEYGKTFYNPLGGNSQSGGVSPQDPFYQTLQTYANLLANNQGAAIPASITGNSVLNAQLQQMAKQINPNYNYNVAQGVGNAQQSNAEVGGTAGVQANQQVFNKAYGDYSTLQNAVQNVDQFGSLLTNGMKDQTGNSINPFDVKYANQTLSGIRSQLSNAQQATFDTTLAALRSRISGLLSIGGNEIPTDISADARKIIDGSLPLSSLSSVLQRIQAEGNILLQNQAQLVNRAYAGTQGQQSGGNNTNSNANNPSLFHF